MLGEVLLIDVYYQPRGPFSFSVLLLQSQLPYEELDVHVLLLLGADCSPKLHCMRTLIKSSRGNAVLDCKTYVCIFLSNIMTVF